MHMIGDVAGRSELAWKASKCASDPSSLTLTLTTPVTAVSPSSACMAASQTPTLWPFLSGCCCCCNHSWPHRLDSHQVGESHNELFCKNLGYRARSSHRRLTCHLADLLCRHDEVALLGALGKDPAHLAQPACMAETLHAALEKGPRVPLPREAHVYVTPQAQCDPRCPAQVSLCAATHCTHTRQCSSASDQATDWC